MKRIVFASGGSGGHLAPAIALAQQSMPHGIRAWIATTEKQVDKRMQEAYPELDFVGWKGVGYDGSLKTLIGFGLHLLKSIPLVLSFLDRERIDLVVTTGGFGSAPVILSAIATGKPVFAHESNSVPGKVTRLFASLFSCLWYTRLLPATFRRAKSSKVTGFPLRSSLSSPEKSEAKASLSLDPNRKLVTVFGGSQGSKRLTEFAEEVGPKFVGEGYQLLCVTGPTNYMPAGEPPEGICYLSFVEDMGALYSATDLLISRSGAGSIAEIARFGCPVVLVPLPTSADQHQLKNAQAFSEANAGILLEQTRLDDFARELIPLIENQQKLQKMIEAQQDWNRGNSVEDMVSEIVSGVEEQRV